ncbi:hypothetical protein BDP27DRAFT_1374825 [Rhodocollybia butyracea]|uniref:Uncharacterized protein n=1 Tax=Rhodocollybia butyracea TaxID=206335 RepID=A0A9P5TX89_9AGAR|nr:hypothetical protein BDP27DRAFT_1374825 [Rhodocollybia butyracea]
MTRSLRWHVEFSKQLAGSVQGSVIQGELSGVNMCRRALKIKMGQGKAARSQKLQLRKWTKPSTILLNAQNWNYRVCCARASASQYASVRVKILLLLLLLQVAPSRTRTARTLAPDARKKSPSHIFCYMHTPWYSNELSHSMLPTTPTTLWRKCEGST